MKRLLQLHHIDLFLENESKDVFEQYELESVCRTTKQHN